MRITGLARMMGCNHQNIDTPQKARVDRSLKVSSSDPSWELASDEVPDVLGPTFNHTSPSHNVKAVAINMLRKIRNRNVVFGKQTTHPIWAQESWPVDRQIMDIRVGW